MSLGGAVLIIAQTLPLLAQTPEFALWWNIGGAAVAIMLVVLAVFGRVLPFAVLQASWVATPTLFAVLALMTFSAYEGGDAASVMPWVWTLEPTAVTFFVLWMRPVVAVLAAVAVALLPALSGLVVLGFVPSEVAAATPLHMSNAMFVVIFVGIRARLVRLRRDERDAERQQEEKERSIEAAAQRERVSVIVHDEVLSVMNAAIALTGTAPDALRREAAHALVVLNEPTAPESGSVTTEWLIGRVRDVVLGIEPESALSLHIEGGHITSAVGHTVAAAVEEAIRNSMRHAGHGAHRSVVARVSPDRVSVEIHDDGVGFDLDSVDPQRLGVRRSILRRMQMLPGGGAVIDSAVGAGTVVTVTWTR